MVLDVPKGQELISFSATEMKNVVLFIFRLDILTQYNITVSGPYNITVSGP